MHNTLSQFKFLPIECLQRGEYQPRRDFPEDSLRELAQSIEQQGLIEPLVVRKISNQRFEIIAGERRWRACMLIGLHEIPCVIKDYTDQQAAAVTLIENIQRQDLNLIEEAQGYQRLLKEFHFKQEEIATLIGKSRSHIANLLRLLSLSECVQIKIRSRELSLGHARVLVGLSEQQQEYLTQQSLTETWSVRRLEEEARHCKHKTHELISTAPTPDLLRLQAHLAEQMGAPVEIKTENNHGGWLKIKFFDNDTLTGLLERMGLRYD